LTVRGAVRRMKPLEEEEESSEEEEVVCFLLLCNCSTHWQIC
jgi:hypothetical protein